ncbi:hypothetical protein pb186bvf_020839 [Paramecium bursaria]
MDYKVKYTPAFPIPSGFHIKLIFQPSDFSQSNQFQMHYVDYGLGLSCKLICQLFEYYQLQRDEYVQLNICECPTVSGYIICYNLMFCMQKQLQAQQRQVIQVFQLLSPVYYTIPRSGFFPKYNDITCVTTLKADFYYQTLIASLYFYYYSTQSIPPHLYIKIVVPSGFTIVSTLASLDIISYPQNQKVVPKNQFQLRILNALYSPGLNGNGSNQASVYDSFSMPVVQPNTLQVYSISHIPSTTNFKSIVDIQFTTMLAIPSAQQIYRATDLRGCIELQFSVSATEWTSDLGTGLSDGSTIPCYGIQNMVPYKGNLINCTLYLGSATQYAKIVINNFKTIASNTKVRFMSLYTFKYCFTTTPTATTCANVPQYAEIELDLYSIYQYSFVLQQKQLQIHIQSLDFPHMILDSFNLQILLLEPFRQRKNIAQLLLDQIFYQQQLQQQLQLHPQILLFKFTIYIGQDINRIFQYTHQQYMYLAHIQDYFPKAYPQVDAFKEKVILFINWIYSKNYLTHQEFIIKEQLWFVRLYEFDSKAFLSNLHARLGKDQQTFSLIFVY